MFTAFLSIGTIIKTCLGVKAAADSGIAVILLPKLFL